MYSLWHSDEGTEELTTQRPSSDCRVAPVIANGPAYPDSPVRFPPSAEHALPLFTVFTDNERFKNQI